MNWWSRQRSLWLGLWLCLMGSILCYFIELILEKRTALEGCISISSTYLYVRFLWVTSLSSIPFIFYTGVKILSAYNVKQSYKSGSGIFCTNNYLKERITKFFISEFSSSELSYPREPKISFISAGTHAYMFTWRLLLLLCLHACKKTC